MSYKQGHRSFMLYNVYKWERVRLVNCLPRFGTFYLQSEHAVAGSW